MNILIIFTSYLLGSLPTGFLIGKYLKNIDLRTLGSGSTGATNVLRNERPEGVIERADRLEANEELPFIIIDAAETSVEIPILQFPLWVAFAGSDSEIYDDLELN